ncbi:MAG: hypothetical protein COB88_08535 [Flavobacteriales bacterium]|nr:MAG: hypothetical protein COB88_08535 [Flavobacteriales bacterium]
MKASVQIGLITGLIAGIWQHIEYLNGISHDSFGGVAGFIPYFILFAGIGAGIYYRRNSTEFGLGYLSFKEGARTGVMISLAAGFCLAVYAMLHGLVINPEYLNEYLDFVREALEKQNKTAEEIEVELADIRNSGSVGKLMFAKFSTTLIIGMVASFIIAALFKRDPVGSAE